jgi:3D (Asp-Asp-Asp) domain-containing protein
MSDYYNWGMGVPSPVTGKSYKLRPFRSIAVDPAVLKIGKWYYVKQLDGVTMPSPVSGLVHDGCVRAVDEGYGIFGRHIDFFAGMESAYEKLVNGSSTIGGRETVTVYDGSVKCAIHIERGY